jgi:hypothetical protein
VTGSTSGWNGGGVGTDVKLREATAADLPAIIRHRRGMFREMHAAEALGFTPTNEMRLLLK